MNTLKIIEGQSEIPFRVWHPVCDAFFETKDSNIAYNLIKDWHKQSIIQILQSEIEYWKDIFDKRPKDRDLESDNIAQNFARIEIDRLTNLVDNLK